MIYLAEQRIHDNLQPLKYLALTEATAENYVILRIFLEVDWFDSQFCETKIT